MKISLTNKCFSVYRTTGSGPVPPTPTGETYTEVALIMGESGGTVYSMSFPCTLGPDFKCEFEGSIEKDITATAVGKNGGAFRTLMTNNKFYLDILSTSNRITISKASSKGLGLHDYMHLELTNRQVKNNGNVIKSGTTVSFERIETEVLIRIVDMKAHSLKIYDGSNVIFDGVAALRDSDGQGGLWDSTRKIFMTNEDIEINETD